MLYPYMMQVRYLLQSYFLASFAFAWSHAVARAGVPWPQSGKEKCQAQGADRGQRGGGVGYHGKVWPFAESLGPQGHLELELEEQEISFQAGSLQRIWFRSEFFIMKQIGNLVRREILDFKSVY